MMLQIELNSNWGKATFASKLHEVLSKHGTEEDSNKLQQDLNNLALIFHGKKGKGKGNLALKMAVNETFLAHQMQKNAQKVLDNLGKMFKAKSSDRLNALSLLVCLHFNENIQNKGYFFKNLSKIQKEIDEIVGKCLPLDQGNKPSLSGSITYTN
jgi:hypothetical protein